MLACTVTIKDSTASPSLQPELHDFHFMEQALQQAALAPQAGEVPIGAVLVHNHQVIAAGHNYRELLQDPTAHAEMVVIRKAAEQLRTWRLTKTTLYVTLEPCPMCAGAIVQSRIARLVFGAWDPKAGACGSIFDIPAERRLNHRVQVMGGLLEQESRELLQTFFRAKRGALSESSSSPKPAS
jgi:tRNA(adenine34) deaminase